MPKMPVTTFNRPVPKSNILDPRSFHHLLGGLRHGKIGSLPISLLYFQLFYFLRDAEKNFKAEIGSIPRRLLEDNERPGRVLTRSDMLAIDADVVFSYDSETQKTDIQFKAYFDNPGFERPAEQHRVVLHIFVTEMDGLKRNISLPLQALMVGWGDVTEGSQGYSHSIALLKDGRALEQWYYIGITTRNWLQRMEEHFHEVRSGSNKRFHAAWRSYTGNAQVILCSELIVLNHTYEGIMDWEEEQVDLHITAGNSLNMIPGGFKGLRFLHEHRLTHRLDITFEKRDSAIVQYAKAEYKRRGRSGAGIPNLLLSKLWLDDEFYLKVLAGRSDVLTPAQVVAIRQLAAAGKTEAHIADLVEARNIEQVKRVLTGKTYRRIA
jgi:hypothetical protein